MQFKRRLSPNATVDLVPMIDVVFQLVIFFMVSSTFILTPGINVVLPESSTAEPVAMSKMVITVVSRDELYINKEKHTMASFKTAISDAAVKSTDDRKTVIIEGERELPYSLLVEVLDVLRKNGFKGLNLKMKELPD
jgi:biopolymer transport protein ExbD